MENELKICFCGLGSIGQRHIVNLDKILKQRKIKYQIDALRTSSRQLSPEITKILNLTYTELKYMKNNYDIVFITNPTAYHFETIQRFMDRTQHMFIEKPIFHTTDVHFEQLKFKPNGIYYVACPLRYSPVIRYLKDYVKEKRVFSVRVICSSYLPDWRKDNDYRKIYSASKEMGGGVALDLIHEWDYITYLFGTPKTIKMLKGKYSNLGINSEDIAIYIAEYPERLVELHLDYFGRVPQREMLLYTDDELIKADILNNTVTFYVKGEVLKFDKENMYINEMNNFIDQVLNSSENGNTPQDAYNCLKIALGEI